MTYNKAGAVRASLENICDEKNREAAVETGATIARIFDPKLFHTGEGLSPASGIARDRQGRTFVADEFNHRILVYGPDLAVQNTIGSKGNGTDQFHYPRGLALDGEGNFYVADAWNHRVVVVGPDGTATRTIGKLGANAGELDEPCGVAIWKDRLYVLEKSNHRVQAFTLEGETLGTIGARGTADEQDQFYVLYGPPQGFQPPVFEFPSAIAADRDGNIFVADTNNHRLVKIRPDLGYDSSFNPSGLRYPVGVACDAEGNIHVTQFSKEGVLAVSPLGIALYRYLPPGLEVPVTICVADGNTLVAGGMKAGVCQLSFAPGHDAGAALETEFTFHLRHGLSAAATGDWATAAFHLGAAPRAEGKDLKAFTTLLPEADFAVSAPTAPPKVEGFVTLLNECSDGLWGELETLLTAKVAAADENTAATLQLEKALLLGGGNVDPLMVDRFSSIKKLHTVSSAIKKTACALKKTEELARRFAHAGIGADGRLARLSLHMSRIAEWKRKREEWFTAAAKEAPSLSFNSLPDERATFALNEGRVDLLGFEFRLFWGLAGEQNRELASLLVAGRVNQAALEGHLSAATDFSLFSPEDLGTRYAYLITLDTLLTACTPAFMGEIASMGAPPASWEQLGREDNIPYETHPEVYHLFPGLWAEKTLASTAPVNVEAWDKITGFYHAEFRKFVAENTPLRTEFVRSAQMQPLAEKTDPKQSAILLRKLGLLRFHNLFQERYIGNMMAEYAVRFALFRLKNGPFSAEQIRATAEKLESLQSEAAAARTDAGGESLRLVETAARTRDIPEKQKLRVQHSIALLTEDFHSLLSASIAPAECAVGGTPAVRDPRHPRVADMDGSVSQLWHPSGMAFGPDGNLYVMAQYGIFVFDANGRFTRRIGGYGKAPGKLHSPLDIAFLPDGMMAASQAGSRTLQLFDTGGANAGAIHLKGDEGRQPLRIQADAEGNLFIGFIDGGDISVYDRHGSKTGAVTKKGGPLEYIERIHGFVLHDNLLLAAGNGRLTAATPDGTAAKASLDVACGTVASLCVDEKGNVFGADSRGNRVFMVDAALSSAARIAPLNSLKPGAVAARNGVLAVADNAAHRVILTGF